MSDVCSTVCEGQSALVVASEEAPPLVQVKALIKRFGGRRTQQIQALRGISFEIRRGQTFGLVGESGSGKSTAARLLLWLTEPTSGRILFEGVDLASISPRKIRQLRKSIQFVSQNPYEALNPRMKIGALIEEPLRLLTNADTRQRAARVRELLSLVSLDAALLARLPHQLSGGQLQRVCIARALAAEPSFIVLDEPTSALDVSTRASILQLLHRLQQELGLTYLLISHDLATVQGMCDEVAVMYLGLIVEKGPSQEVFSAPKHPYTQALLSAVLLPDPTMKRTAVLLKGESPAPTVQLVGCVFAPRCPLVGNECREEMPADVDLGNGHTAACCKLEGHLRSQQ